MYEGSCVGMKKKVYFFAGGFAITLILIGALCGFMAVDLSTDRYMPGRFGSVFSVSSLDAGGMTLSWMGVEYGLASPLAQLDAQTLLQLRGALPLPWQAASGLGTQLYQALTGAYDQPQNAGQEDKSP